MNVQFAIQGERRRQTRRRSTCSRSTRAPRAPCRSSRKATGQPLAKIAARCMVGQTLASAEASCAAKSMPPYFSVKEAVFPFNKFPGVDPILGPEMRSTGEVMGVGRTFGEAMLKSQLGAGSRLPTQRHGLHHGEEQRQAARGRGRARPARRSASSSSRPRARRRRSPRPACRCSAVNKVKDGRPHIVDMIKNGEIQLVFTTVDETRTAIADSRHIRTGGAGPPGHVLHHHGGLRGGGRRHEAPATTWASTSLQELHAELH